EGRAVRGIRGQRCQDTPHARSRLARRERGGRMTASPWYVEAMDRVCGKLGRSSRRIGTSFPEASYGGRYTEVSRTHWVAGFWPGLLWTAYAAKGDEQLK